MTIRPEQFGKMPPQAVDLEEAVLGALLMQPKALLEITFLKPEMFYKESHKKVFETILELDRGNKPIDLLTVTNQLRSKGYLEFIGGPAYISELTNKVGSSANIEYHSRTIVEKWVLRKVIELSTDATNRAYDETTDPFKLLDDVDENLLDVYKGFYGKTHQSVGELLPGAIQEMEQIQANENKLMGYPIGNSELDRYLHGWIKTSLILVAARPGMGKTTKMIHWAYFSAVVMGEPTVIFSLEMSARQLTYKFISKVTGIDNDRILNGDLTPDEWQLVSHKMTELEQAPLYIEDEGGLTSFEIKNRCRRLIKEKGITKAYIDYAQIIGKSDKKMSLYNHVTEVSQDQKNMAKSLNIPVILFSQLSRSVEQRGGDCRPMLSDLRESGALEENGEQIMFLYRPEYYNITEEEGEPTEGKAEIIIKKNRHGKLGTVTEYVNLGTSSYADGNGEVPF